MKTPKYIVVILVMIVLISSCGKDTNDNSEKDKLDSAVQNVATVVKDRNKLQKNFEDLRNTVQLTKAQFEAWLPQSLIGLPLTFSQINFMPGLSSCGANYNVGNKKIRVMVIDGAGEKGAGGVGPYRLSSKMDYDTEDSWGYTKTKTIHGLKVKESYNKSAKSFNVSMFYGERFAVDIKTYEIEQSDLKQIIEDLHLDELIQ